MHGVIDTTYSTNQNDMFASGLAAEIGSNAYFIYDCIKTFADYNDGEAWPGQRKLSELTGISKGSVTRAIDILVSAHLLRILEKGKGKASTRYLARERLVVRLGDRVLCTIVVDYIPKLLPDKLRAIKTALAAGTYEPEAFADVEIIPGTGFTWDAEAGLLRAKIPSHEIPQDDPLDTPMGQVMNVLQNKVQALRLASNGKKKSR